MPDWLVQNLVSNIIYGVLIVGTGALFAWLKAKRPAYAPHAIYALASMTCVAILMFAVTGRPVWSTQPHITPDNVEEYVRKWADSLSLGVTRAPSPSPDGYFGVLITLKSGNGVVVGRGKEVPDYLQIQIPLVMTTEHQAAFSKLTKDQQKTIVEEVTLEMARAKIGNMIVQAMVNDQPQSPTIVLQSNPPIEGLTKDGFVNRLDAIDSAITLVRATTFLALARAQPITLHPQ